MQDIYVDDIGNGFPLVLVHGFLGSSEIWSPQKNFLANITESFRLPYLDLEKALQLSL